MVLLWIISLLLIGGFRLGAQEPPEPNKFIGSQVSQACHPDLWHGFNRNPHFQSVALDNSPPEKTGCEGCHGPGELHVKGMGDQSKITRFPFLEPSQVISRCLTCHSKDIGKTEIRRSSHSTGEVSCISCHSVHHSPERRNLLAAKQREVCYECHLDIRARFELPFKHRVNEGAIECTDCHNPHGAPTSTWATAQSPRMVSHAFGSDIACVKCHTDKRGPFLHEHPPVRVEGCLECHNGVVGFGPRVGGIPGPNTPFHNIAEPRFQNCVTCHPRIHGSNVDALFRR